MTLEPRALDVRLEVRPTRQRPFALDLAFRAEPGVTVLFGPSGAGKSTTLAAIAGLLRPDEGHVRVGSTVWCDRAQGVDVAVHKRSVAMVQQTLALFPHLSALDNVAYGLARGLSRSERQRQAQGLLERMRVGHLALRHPGSLSGGEAQRVALARAFARAPQVVLLDEPFTGLERTLRDELWAEVRAWTASLGVPLVHVTHDREAAADADWVVELRAGRRWPG